MDLKMVELYEERAVGLRPDDEYEKEEQRRGDKPEIRRGRHLLVRGRPCPSKDVHDTRTRDRRIFMRILESLQTSIMGSKSLIQKLYLRILGVNLNIW